MLLSHEPRPDSSAALGTDPEGLIREARRRTRRRRAWRGVAIGLFVGLAMLAILEPTSGGPGVVGETASWRFANLNAFAGQGRVAFVSRGRMWVLDGARGVLRGLPAPAGDTASVPTFSRDGRWLAYLETLGGRAARAVVAGAC